MEVLRRLKINKLIKELDYLKSDLNYKHSLINEANSIFMDNINIFLKDHPLLKEAFDKIHNNDYQENEVLESNDVMVSDNIENDSAVIIDSKVKNLYRNIAKIAHPDKVGDDVLKDVYINAKDAYDKNDIVSIVTICDKLNIPYDLSDEEMQLILEELNRLKKSISLIESSFTWQWYNQEDDASRDLIMAMYIKSIIK